MSRESREREATEGRGGEELPERWSTRRKVEVVLRLLRGEDLGEGADELQVVLRRRWIWKSGAECSWREASRG